VVTAAGADTPVGLLRSRVAVVTGAASGIGLAIAQRFIAQGASVILGDIQDEKGSAAATSLGENARYRHSDVLVEADVSGLVDEAVDAFGRLDIFVNNAGAQGDPSPIVDLTSEGVDRTLALLTRSAVLGHKYAARQFESQGTPGSIITTASVAGLEGGWSTAGYTMHEVDERLAELDGLRGRAEVEGGHVDRAGHRGCVDSVLHLRVFRCVSRTGRGERKQRHVRVLGRGVAGPSHRRRRSRCLRCVPERGGRGSLPG
jgi:hypothetical protein